MPLTRSVLRKWGVAICLLAVPVAGIALSHKPAGAAPSVAFAPPGSTKGRETGLSVPRFISLKSGNARMRIGPSFDYGTRWVYVKSGLPLEITAEYDNWRRVRDSDGITGWVHRSLLSARRSAVVGPWLKEPTPLRTDRRAEAAVVARLAPRVLVSVESCDGAWCAVKVKGHDVSGVVDQSALWGVYPQEIIQ